ncbi:hypothetical protein [Methylovulum psychrotolerans]|uniref:Uncharacterized protein n=1 Tax=Methylovulum psychrotolerans TaxID=1704499 RepID=A0A1Z4C4D8_9GAMM|nr:hypothetical protein [Methylovulum psychrotolerans]ASF48411.1 hypothetical protein CEK71_21400 [Methylovulum psychrotolerans]
MINPNHFKKNGRFCIDFTVALLMHRLHSATAQRQIRRPTGTTSRLEVLDSAALVQSQGGQLLDYNNGTQLKLF